MECNFYQGQKVVCVDAKPRHYPNIGLVYGRVYTIYAVLPPLYKGGSWGVSLVEASAASLYGYYADRFRPAVDRSVESGMSVLKKILKEKEKETV